MSLINLHLFNQSPKDVQRLIHYADALMRSGSHPEEVYWHKLLSNLVDKLLATKKNNSIEQALDLLVQHDLFQQYEILLEHAESKAESILIEHEGIEYDALLFTAPVTLWTRYQLPGGHLPDEPLAALRHGLQEHILASGAKLALLNELVNYDTMPETFQEVRDWTRKLAQLALGMPAALSRPRPCAETGNLLADARFLLGVIVTPRNEPLFRWQQALEQPPVALQHCLQEWQQLCQQHLTPLFTGCQVQYLPPNGYYHNTREADREIRPLAIQAGVTWLQTAANVQPDELTVTIAACGAEHAEEYRVGFSTKGASAVIYGCIWPILSQEEADSSRLQAEHIDIPDIIAALLKSLGVDQIQRLPGLYPNDTCDDCQAPYFPDVHGEMQHPELPDEIDLDPVKLH